MMFIGIDPGVHGAVAILNDKEFFGVWDAPLDEENAYGLGRYDLHKAKKSLVDLKKLLKGNIGVEVLIERVHAMPNSGAHSGFLQGEGVMLWKALCIAIGFPVAMVEPQAWRQEYFEPTEKENRKHESIVMARALFPTAQQFLTREKDDGRAEALLIAEFCRRVHEKQMQ